MVIIIQVEVLFLCAEQRERDETKYVCIHIIMKCIEIYYMHIVCMLGRHIVMYTHKECIIFHTMLHTYICIYICNNNIIICYTLTKKLSGEMFVGNENVVNWKIYISCCISDCVTQWSFGWTLLRYVRQRRGGVFCCARVYVLFRWNRGLTKY